MDDEFSPPTTTLFAFFFFLLCCSSYYYYYYYYYCTVARTWMMRGCGSVSALSASSLHPPLHLKTQTELFLLALR